MIERGGNGFADLGLPDADGYLLLAELVTRLDKIIRELGLKQLEAAKLLRLELANRWRDRWTRRRRFWMCFLVAGMIVGGLGRLVPDRTVFGATLRTTPMITTNVLFRVFHIAWGDSTGTAFTIDHASKQYLVTARHVVKGIGSGDSIRVFHEEQWKNLPVDVVGIGEGDADIAVLSCPVRLSPSFDFSCITSKHDLRTAGFLPWISISNGLWRRKDQSGCSTTVCQVRDSERSRIRGCIQDLPGRARKSRDSAVDRWSLLQWVARQPIYAWLELLQVILRHCNPLLTRIGTQSLIQKVNQQGYTFRKIPGLSSQLVFVMLSS